MSIEGTHGAASLLLDIFEKHRCSRELRADLINFLHLPGLDVRRLPASPSAFASFARAVIPRSVSPSCLCSVADRATFLQTEYQIVLDNVKVTFFDMLEVAAEAIRSEPGTNMHRSLPCSILTLLVFSRARFCV